MTKKALVKELKTVLVYKDNKNIIDVLLQNGYKDIIKFAVAYCDLQDRDDAINTILNAKDLLLSNNISKVKIVKFINVIVVNYFKHRCLFNDYYYRTMQIFEYDFFKTINDQLLLSDKDKEVIRKETIFKVYARKSCDKTDYILSFIDLNYLLRQIKDSGIYNDKTSLNTLAVLLFKTENNVFKKLDNYIEKLPTYPYAINLEDDNVSIYLQKLISELFENKNYKALKHIFDERINKAIICAYLNSIKSSTNKINYLNNAKKIIEDNIFKEVFGDDFIETLVALIKVLSQEDKAIVLLENADYFKNRVKDLMLLKAKFINEFSKDEFNELKLTLTINNTYSKSKLSFYIKDFLDEEHFNLFAKVYGRTDEDIAKTLSTINKTDEANAYILSALEEDNSIFSIAANQDKCIIDSFILKAKQKELLHKFTYCFDTELKKNIALEIEKLKDEWLKIIKETAKAIQYVPAELKTTDFLAKAYLLREWVKKYLDNDVLTQINLYLELNKESLTQELKKYE